MTIQRLVLDFRGEGGELVVRCLRIRRGAA
jgi:hypothetical protein